MNNAKIIGIGCTCRCGNSITEVVNNLKKDSILNTTMPLKFDVNLSKLLKRKSDRDTLLGVYGVQEALLDAGIKSQEIDNTKIGTIFSSGQGTVNTSLKFSTQINENKEFCSPALFSKTVNNAMLGIICMEYGFKGVSTMLVGANNLPLSLALLSEKKADYIFSGYVEGYSEELFESFEYKRKSKYELFESTVCFLITNKNVDEYYCEIVNYSEENISLGFFGEKIKEECIKKISSCINSCIENFDGHIDVIIPAFMDGHLRDIEWNLIKKDYESLISIDNVKEKFGETMGCSLFVNLMIASILLKNNFIMLSEDKCNNKSINNILVCGIDDIGNYICVLVSR